MNYDKWQQARAECDFTASDVPEACGIGYNSRAAWARGERPVPSGFLQRKLDDGKNAEGPAAGTYAEHLLAEDEYMTREVFVARKVDIPDGTGFTIGATTDALVGSAADISPSPRRVVEMKYTAAREPKANHVLQCATQVWVARVPLGHLFYYQSDGSYICWEVRCSDEDYTRVVLPWLDEARLMRGSQDPLRARMLPGERTRREKLVFETFLADRHSIETRVVFV
jgi:hypothetical protein